MPGAAPAANQTYEIDYVHVATLPDAPGDGVPDWSDNCSLVANPAQIDSDYAGFGNQCDADMNNNGATNAQDYVLFRQLLCQPPGPSGTIVP